MVCIYAQISTLELVIISHFRKKPTTFCLLINVIGPTELWPFKDAYTQL